MSEFTYETKCRICGEITEWAFPGYETFDKNSQIEWQITKLNYPTEGHCEKCDRMTVQDLVAFNRDRKEKKDE